MPTDVAAAPDAAVGPSAVVDRLRARAEREGRVAHVQVRPARAARTAPWPAWAHADLVAAYAAQGITAPWQHQVEAAEAVRAGRHVVVSTGTASGKSLAYQLPALTRVLEGRRTAGRATTRRGPTVLYVAPTKALAHDQLSSVARLGLDVRASTHDGDSSREERAWTRDHADYVLTNPDMLHHSMLPGHERWHGLWSSLELVVVDEAHHYRGVFGAQVAQVLRRLRRVAALHGAAPRFVLASATMAEPAEAAARLTGLDVAAVGEDASPRGAVTIAIWQPPLSSFTGELGTPLRRAASSESADLLADLVSAQVRTLAFVRSRRGAEQVALTAADLVGEVDRALAGRVASYRGGYLPEERRALEADLREGRLLGLAATNALELGIDVSGLDAVVIAGFPGTRAAFWQQAGRAGRRGGEALVVLVARDDPLDTYLLHHPDALLGRPVEATVFDPGNPHVLGPHLCAAAQEAPLTDADLPMFGPGARAVLDGLTRAGLLRHRSRGWFWTAGTRASDLADLRSASGPPVQLIERDTGRVIGTVDAAGAHATAHAGAVYLHRGDTWLVEDLDLGAHVAVMARAEPPWTTTARETTDIAIVAEAEHEQWGACRLSTGQVEVTHQVVSYLRRGRPGGEILEEVPLDLPPRVLRTCAVWWTVPDAVLDRALADAGLDPADLPGSAHAAEHCAIGLLPLFATCDRWDIGGVSTARHRDTGLLTVFVHDGHPGGAGFAERGYRAACDWLTATRETLATCPCADGCPSCVQSPKCGNGNQPLHKQGAVMLLDALLAQAPRLRAAFRD